MTRTPSATTKNKVAAPSSPIVTATYTKPVKVRSEPLPRELRGEDGHGRPDLNMDLVVTVPAWGFVNLTLTAKPQPTNTGMVIFDVALLVS